MLTDIREEHINIYDIINPLYMENHEYKFRELKKINRGTHYYVYQQDEMNESFVLYDINEKIAKTGYIGYYLIVVEYKNRFVIFIGNATSPYIKEYSSKFIINKNTYMKADLEKFISLIKIVSKVSPVKDKVLVICNSNTDLAWFPFKYKKMNTIKKIKLFSFMPIVESFKNKILVLLILLLTPIGAVYYSQDKVSNYIENEIKNYKNIEYAKKDTLKEQSEILSKISVKITEYEDIIHDSRKIYRN